jgi:ribA/ribD-fused uncharacterized protein
MKAFIPADAERVRHCRTPGEAKHLGRRIPLRPDWEHIKYEVMLVGLKAKFTQHAHLKELLLSTGTAAIHENRPDPVWGGGPNYPKGKDLLGKALMRVRAAI